MNLYGIHPKEISVYWPYILPLLNKPFTRMELVKDYDTDYVYERVKDARMQCWIAHEDDKITAVFVTEVISRPKRKVLSVPFIGAEKGTIDTWIEAIDMFKSFAKEHGCDAIVGVGRRGWEKALHPDSIKILYEFKVGV